MADIVAWGDKHKKLLKIAESWLRKKMGANITVVHEDLSHCGNPVFSRITYLLNEAADNVSEKYQEKVIREYGELLLWILYKDTAYRDPAMWVLYQLLKNADIILKELEPYVNEPEDWYVNAWNESKKNTAEQRKKGKVSAVTKSLDESIFTPAEQNHRLRKYKVE